MKKINTKEMMALYEQLQSNCTRMTYTSGIQNENLVKENVAIRQQMNDTCLSLTQAIDSVQKRAKVRKIDAETILKRLHEVSDYLGISKKALKGTSVIVNDDAQSFPNAYKGTPESTYFKAEYNGTAWMVTDIYRAECGKKKFKLELSETAKEAYLKKAENLGY